MLYKPGLHTSFSSTMAFVMMLIFCLWPCCNALENEKCNFSVAMMKTAEKFSCFRIMDGNKPICSTGKSTSSCEIHYRHGYMCLKWPADIELNCVSDSFETLNGNITCALDQKSISCDGEYQSQSKDSVSTLTMSIPLTIACAVMAIILWMALLDY